MYVGAAFVIAFWLMIAIFVVSLAPRNRTGFYLCMPLGLFLLWTCLVEVFKVVKTGTL